MVNVCVNNKADLRSVRSESDFVAYYTANSIENGDISGKIRLLEKDMGILASRCEGEETPAEELAGLEEYALSGLWRAS
ncbi:MAG: hypothetical protein LBI42_06040 [Chitinispirillales bacterium]|jgi:hypothetical protein|nr:hypothetical protein [Chitinispirillales bacterium]